MNKFAIIAVSLLVISPLRSAFAVQKPVGVANSISDETVSLVYDQTTGNLGIDTGDKWLTTLQLTSETGVFTGERPAELNGLFDVFKPTKLFKLHPTGFQSFDLGPALPTGMSATQLANDLLVDGTTTENERILPPVNVVANAGDFQVGPDAFRSNFEVADSVQNGIISVIYDPNTGDVGIDGGGQAMKWIRLRTGSSLFTGAQPDDLHAYCPSEVSRRKGFRKLNLGAVLATGIDAETLAADLLGIGSLSGPSPSRLDYSLVIGPVDFETVEAPHDISIGLMPNLEVAESVAEGQLSFVYDPNTGSVAIDPGGQLLGGVSIESPGLFTGPRPAVLGDNNIEGYHCSRLTSLDESSALRVELGPIMEPGLDADTILQSIGVHALTSGGIAKTLPRLVYLSDVPATPEPSSAFLMILSLLGLGIFRRR